MSERDLIEKLINRQVILDMSSPFVYSGTLVEYDESYLVLEDADVHDLRDTTTNRELYVVEVRRLGIRPNRSRVLVRRQEVVGLAAVGDVID